MDKEMKFSKSLAHGIILAWRRRRRLRRRRVSRPRLLSLRARTVAEASFCHFTIRGLLRDVEEDEEEEEVRERAREGSVEEGDRDEVPLRILLQGLLSLLNSLPWA